MADITELAQSHELLIANGNETANLLRHLANNEIDSDYFAVVSECEAYGQETDAELSITEFALRAAGYVDSLVEALEKAQQLETLAAETAIQISKGLAEAYKRVTELESEVKFPGVMRCNACGFSRTHVIATPDGMRAGKSEPENCPNGCGPMWHDTYRRQYDELHDAYTALRESNAQVIKSRDHYKRMSEEGLKQLAESRTVTVKLLKDHVDDADLFGWGVVVVPLEALKEACADAGVTVEIADAGIKVEVE